MALVSRSSRRSIVDWFILQDYELNGVDGTKVNFEDNLECLNLIEKVESYF